MSQSQVQQADIAIIGSGIAGSVLAAVLARQGLHVVVFEASTHPKFSIGESMILETSEIMRMISELFDVPEIEYFSAENFFPAIGTSHGVKRHFSYLFQKPGVPQDLNDALQAVIPQRPYGHELHLFRQDSDYFYATVAIKYGARIFQNTKVNDVLFDADQVEIKTVEHGSFHVKHVVDAGGFRSILAEKFKLRDFRLKTHSRGIFTHMVDVPSYHKKGASRKQYGLPYSLAEGTLHHVFHGGWLWVIPFDNHAQSSNRHCSVGLMLDPRIHPKPDGLSAEQEFKQFIAEYPGIEVQLKGAKAVRNWVYSDRIQYSSSQLVGDRYSLLGHAAGFIDPLFSKGLYTSLSAVLNLGQALIAAYKKDDFRRERLLHVERSQLRFVQANDRLVANAYKSFVHPRLWQQYAVLWILGAYLELVKLTNTRLEMKRRRLSPEQRLAYTLPELSLVGGGYPRFERLAKQVDDLIDAVDTSNEAEILQTAEQIKQIYLQADWIPYSFREISMGKKHLPKRKFTHRLFLTKGGILGDRSFRAHFFPDISLTYLAGFMLKERHYYSTRQIRKRVTQARSGWI